ncbi:beta-ketoacyl synthase chain length factor [Flavihumibacter profundi]|uniref:beta-ketoacyl synthase chain length factor n=1 Tax=Flavihumibacter profundi TaxID=2716883 RepID=UPI001CC48182|nr:beta-ketoacyl synthase chain length factor [Flavihumibacter profundi]MBZ5859137.1 beta-ketoacyl synthase chain length factor [Flavihumibacter profundi]
MLSPVYIRSARAICAQDTFGNNDLPGELTEATGNSLHYLHPDYSKYFTIMQLRRMSRVTRTGLVAAIESLADAGIKKPEAIITGTGKGSIYDTEKFIQNILEFHEGTLNPTPFIQSTYNSLNGLIGLQYGASCYNTTYVHRGFSLELALTDAMMLLQEGEIEQALVGCFEEISPEHYIIKQKLGAWKKEPVSCRELIASKTTGSIAGEGTFFFVVQKNKAGALAKLSGLRMLFEPTVAAVLDELTSLLKEHHLRREDIDLVILGYNGDVRHNHYYDAVLAASDTSTCIQCFKPACGEFDTAVGFAVWMAAWAAQRQQVFPSLTIRPAMKGPIKNIIIYNHYQAKDHVLYLLQQTED